VGFDCTPPTFVARAFPIQQRFSADSEDLPPAVDHRSNGMEGPVKNQGAVGTCTALSLSSAMEHELRRGGLAEDVSAIHIWSQYSVPEMGSAGDSNVDKRITAQATWPYDPAEACKMMRRSDDACGAAYGVRPNSAGSDPVIRTKKVTADGAGRYQLIGIEKLASHEPNQIAAILAGGDDLWVAFNMNWQAWKSSAMVNHVIQDYVPNDSSGHAVVLAGYRTVNGRKQFLIHNSWGAEWGDRGYAWISENMVRFQLRYGYRVRVARPGSAPGPQPGPQPSAGNDGCGAGQARDVVTGQCAAACGEGSRRAAGVCVPSFGGGPQPPPASSNCPQGQGNDVVTGACVALCPNARPPMGGLCLPQL
jgi:hypothetical protein